MASPFFSKAEPIFDHAICFATCGDLNTAFVGWWFWMYSLRNRGRMEIQNP